MKKLKVKTVKLRLVNKTEAFARELVLADEITRLKHALRNAECAARLLGEANDILHARLAERPAPITLEVMSGTLLPISTAPKDKRILVSDGHDVWIATHAAAARYWTPLSIELEQKS